MTTPQERPDFVTDEMLDYLDELRESSDTNMFGAGPYLDGRFPELWANESSHTSFHSSPRARAVLSYWMHSERAERRREW